ncbi:OB-fold nucleic acid binding domain-containing protein, partial [Desulfobacterales bacterium HSG17]|nr:OB-fold nucleic acid binding domain-containing protein [Desulfobacterales bacterium HSG17]
QQRSKPNSTIQQTILGVYMKVDERALGFYISGHPLDRHQEVLDKFTNVNGVTVKEADDGKAIRMGGLITAIKSIRTRRGDPMAFITMEDMHGSIEVTVFNRLFEEVEPLLAHDNVVLVQGQLQREENAVKILADSMIPMNEAEKRLTGEIHVTAHSDKVSPDMLKELNGLLERHEGDTAVILHLRQAGQWDVVLTMPDHLRVRAGNEFATDVMQLFGYQAVDFRCSEIVLHPQPNGFKRKFKTDT